MTSREFTSTQPQIVTVAKPKVSDFAGQVFIGAEIRDAVSGVSGVPATQHEDAVTQVEIEQLITKTSSHVEEKRIVNVTSSTETPLVEATTTATMTEVRIEPAQPVVVHSIPPAPQKIIETETIGIQWLADLKAVEVQAVGEVKEKPITLSFASQVDLIPFQTAVTTLISEVPRSDYRSTATITETMVEPTKVSVQAIRPPQSSPITTSSKLYLDQINTGISPPTMELSTTVSSIPKVSMSSLGIMTELMAVQADGWTQADYVEPETVIQSRIDISTVETAPPVQPTMVRIGGLQTPYQTRHEGVTSEVEVEKPLAKVEISSAQCPIPAKLTLETATSQCIYIPERYQAPTKEVPPPKAVMRTHEVQVSLPQAELISSALEVGHVDVGIPAPERRAVVNRGVETITIEEPEPTIKPVEHIIVSEAPPLVVQPLPVKIRYGKIETPIQERYEVIHEQPVKLESMAIANAGIRVIDEVLVRSTETVLSTKTVNSSMQTDLAVKVQSRAVSTGEVIESPRSPKLTTKSGYMQVQSSVPVHVKPQTGEKYCNTESVLLTQKSVQVTSVEKPREVMEIVVVTTQTEAMDVKAELTCEYIEKAKEMTTSSAVFDKPAMGSTSTMTEMLIEPTKPAVVFSTPPLQLPEPIHMKIAASECIPRLSDTIIEAPSISITEAVVESVKQTLDVPTNTLTIECSDRNIQTQSVVSTKKTEVALKPVQPSEVTSSIGGPVLKNEGISAVAEEQTTTITSVTEAPVVKVSTRSVGITPDAAPVGLSRGTETVAMEVTVPIIKPEQVIVTREAPPIERPRLRYGKEQTPKVPTSKVKYIAVGTPVQVKTVMKLGEVQAVQEIPISGATSSLIESIPTIERVQVSTVEQMVEKPKEVVSAIPMVLKATSTSSIQVSPPEGRSTATITESRIEPTKQVVVHAFAPAKPLEIASTGLDIGQTDTQTDVHSEGLLTTVSSVVELPIRQSEVTIGAEVKYSDAQTTAEAEELKTLVSSWAEEVIIRTIPAPVVEAPPPLPMTPILTSVRYRGVQTLGKKHLEAASGTEPTEYKTSLSGRLEAVKSMNIHEAQTIIEEQAVKPAMVSTGIQPIEESVAPIEVAKQSSVTTEWVVELKDRSLLTETPSTTDVSTTEPTLEIHSVVSSALQAEPEQIIKEVVAEPVVMAAPPVAMRFGKMQTQIQQYNSTATMTSREFTSTQPQIVTVAKPKVSDFAGQVFIGAEIRDAVSGVSGVPATQHEDAVTQVEIEQLITKTSSHVEEKRIVNVTSSTETPLVEATTTATMTEVRIEPAQPVVVHSIPPAPQKIIETETIGIQWLADLKAVEVQAVGEVKEKPITLSFASQVDLIPFQTAVTTLISEVPRSDYRSTATITETMVEPTKVSVQAIRPPQSSPITTSSKLYLDQINTGISPPTMELSTTVSSIPKVSMSSLGIMTELMAVQADGWTQADYVEPETVIQSRIDISTVETAPPVQPTMVRIGGLQTPYQTRHEGVTSEVEVEKPLAKVEISSAQCPIPAKLTLETATSQCIYIPERYQAPTKEVPPPKAVMRTHEVQVSLPQAELISSALEVGHVDVGIPAPERRAVVNRGVETITIEEPEPTIKPVEHIIVSEAPPLVVQPLPVKIRYGKIETPIQERYEVIHEQPVKLESMAIANAGIRVIDEVLVRSTETVLSTKTVNSSMQTDLAVKVQSRAVSTGEVIESPRSPKLTTKSGYMQVQSSVPVHVKPQTGEKYCNTESVLLTQKSVQVTSVEKPREVMEIVVVTTQTEAMDVKAELTCEYIEKAKEMTTSSAVFDKPAMGSTSTMTEMLIEPTKPAVVFSTPPLQLPEPIHMKIAASECIPRLSDTIIEAPSISITEAVVESVKQTLDVPTNTLTIECSDRNIQTQSVVSTKKTEVALKPVQPSEVTSSIGGPVLKNEGISAVAEEQTTTITSVTEAPVVKVSTRSVGITPDAAPVGLSRGTETVAMEVTVPIIKPEQVIVTREAPPIERPRLRYGKEQTPKVPTSKVKYIAVGTPVQVKTVMKLGEVQAVQEIPISGATSSLIESIPTIERVQVSTVEQMVEKPKEVVSAIPMVLKATSTSSIQVSPPEGRSTATITESRIEPTKQVVVHAFAPAKPLEIASTGLDIGQTDTQTDVHSEGLLTTVSSVVELPIRQSEVTIGAEVKYSDAQTTAEAEELKTLVSSWAEEVIIRTIPAPV
ncbi:unnamed protein product, partial [Rodentolepis nana]|uniref:Titin n=1 Tax=Rodentolepis nana TaxID=102285 RepID=A0A0R3TCI9_RODNA